ncbi:MAG: prepilin-type N-terminal cleavage/methylation domain-containing protein, partial [Desulfobacterales bacterium]
MDFRNETGFTLVELLISIAVASIMGGLIASSFWEQQRSHTTQLEASAVQQNLRAATFVAGREIRLTGYQPHDINKASVGITAAQPDDLTFTYLIDADGDGEVDDTETVNYYLDDTYGDGDNDLVRNAQNFPVAENIDGLEFLYTLADGT